MLLLLGALAASLGCASYAGLSGELRRSLSAGDHEAVLRELEQSKSGPNRLLYLVENGLKYAQGEDAEVVVQTGSQERSGKRWGWVQVADNGPGIPETHLPHLFDRFYRIDSARSQRDEPADQVSSGSGLGLAIVNAIVQMYGGQVEVQNQADRGAIFTVWLLAAA